MEEDKISTDKKESITDYLDKCWKKEMDKNFDSYNDEFKLLLRLKDLSERLLRVEDKVKKIFIQVSILENENIKTRRTFWLIIIIFLAQLIGAFLK